jgi:hypothetical protein
MVVVLAWILTFVSFGHAGPYFTPLREDLSLPANCKEPRLVFFQLPSEKFYVGRKGALSMGFTFEYPIERQHAKILWHYLKDYSFGTENYELYEKIQNNPQLKRDFDIIMSNYDEQGFDFQSEGEVLESLAIHHLYQEFPENLYFITGSVQYHESYSPQTIGEIDVLVGRRDTCETIAVGEVKLGRTLNKAKKQLNRFEDFLLQHDASAFAGDYSPKVLRKVLSGGSH